MSIKINFTQAFISSFQPDAKKRIDLQDTKVPGLKCRVSPSGIKTFSVLRRVKSGKLERITIGRSTEFTVERARLEATKINLMLSTGESAAGLKRAKREEDTLDELFEEYLEKYAKPKKRTWRCDQSNYRLYLKKKLGNKKLSAIKTSDISSIHTQIPQQHKISKKKNHDTKYKSKATANRVLALISKIFNWGILMKRCEKNPAAGISKFTEFSRERFLDTPELPKFFEALKAEPNKAICDYILLSLMTGARKSNVVSMRWENISFARNQWHIPRTKNDESQIIPLVPEAIQILEKRFKYLTEFVFQPQAMIDGDAWEISSVTEVPISNVLQMQWNELSIEKRNWEFIAEDGKRKLQLISETMMLKLIERKKRAEEYVFPGVGQKGHLVEPKSGWKRILKDSKIKNLTLHDLRRTLGSWQAIEGSSGVIIGKSLNHKSPKSTAVYARLNVDPIRKSLETATKAIFKNGGFLVNEE